MGELYRRLPGVGFVQAQSDLDQYPGRERLIRSYRLLFSLSIFLAAIGAPSVMQGAVVFARAVSAGPVRDAADIARSIGILALSASPLALAGYTWKRTQAIQSFLDDND